MPAMLIPILVQQRGDVSCVRTCGAPAWHPKLLSRHPDLARQTASPFTSASAFVSPSACVYPAPSAHDPHASLWLDTTAVLPAFYLAQSSLSTADSTLQSVSRVRLRPLDVDQDKAVSAWSDSPHSQHPPTSIYDASIPHLTLLTPSLRHNTPHSNKMSKRTYLTAMTSLSHYHCRFYHAGRPAVRHPPNHHRLRWRMDLENGRGRRARRRIGE